MIRLLHLNGHLTQTIIIVLILFLNACKRQDPKSLQLPEENRFVREILTYNLNEPMELEYLPNGNILFIERAGDIKIFDQKSRTIIIVAHLNVEWVAEDGLLGMAIDPGFEENHWVYLFHTPNNGSYKQRLSRFDLSNNTLNLESEKILLEFPSTRKCCHSGGSLEFDGVGNLYLSTGDNTNPFESNGYSPSDESPGRSVWDAQKSSANTNDLRGKILRIKPEADGTYSIPDGNLFVDDDLLTRPEIYVMGLRNAFRASLDKKNGILYWGDVGPDAGKDDSTRGPKGHDELNQAKKAGNWGWPYTRGNNKPYFDYDFENEVSLGLFDPNNLVNNSPNNTGIQNLPPAQPSFIWYPYDSSVEFPWIGTGGRNAMAGPVFYSEDHDHSENKFPDYFDNKLFFYDWIRDWIFLITLDENQDYVKSERFMENTAFHNPIDMVFGGDGSLYILEYGESWNTKNLDAQLSKISYVPGNRAPIAKMEVDNPVGGIPLTVNLSGESSVELEGEKMDFHWDFGDGTTADGAKVSHVFERAGNYKVTLNATDSEGLSSEAFYTVSAGNEAPQIEISFESENQFYTRKRPLGYSVIVTDKEDGEIGNGIDASDVSISLSFLPEGMDHIVAEPGHQPVIEYIGEEYMKLSDCAACHRIDEKLNGPSYKQIANKYSASDQEYLIEKIKNGGSGVWGETPMVAHPQLTVNEITEIVKYVFSMADDSKVLSPKGQLIFDQHQPGNTGGVYILTATYTDKGGDQVDAITTQEQIMLKAPVLQAENADDMNPEMSSRNVAGTTVLGNITDGRYFMFENVLFDGLNSVSMRVLYDSGFQYNGTIEVKRATLDGSLLSSYVIAPYLETERGTKSHEIKLKAATGRDKLYFIFRNQEDKELKIANPDYVFLNYTD
ncbi:MAG: PQQ-dependent sugar dehydrogenase [Bacteroidetes bacterium]|nr:PQQ-dependent sugar dehydrogenase [Bacteroidota bacterium]MDA1120500.1 PQQ-dependent sugar dehydrogenase [Bacteroidota bacterium]